MAYQNVPVADGYQVVQQIADFAELNGWAIHRRGEQTDTIQSLTYYEVTLSVTGFSCYLTLAGYTNEIVLNGHRSYNSSARWWQQPDQYFAYDNDGYFTQQEERATKVTVELRVNPILSVHLFAGTTPTPYVYAAIEKEPGYYRHLVFGHMQKFGTALGGMFWDVSSRNTYAEEQTNADNHRAPFLYNSNVQYYGYSRCGGFDTQDRNGNPVFCRMGYDSSSPYSSGGHNGPEADTFMVANPINFNGRTALQTPLVMANVDGYVPFGNPPALRYINLEYFEAGDELVIGNETWKVFPWTRRAPGLETTNDAYRGPEYEASGMYGIAYLKD